MSEMDAMGVATSTTASDTTDLPDTTMPDTGLGDGRSNSSEADENAINELNAVKNSGPAVAEQSSGQYSSSEGGCCEDNKPTSSEATTEHETLRVKDGGSINERDEEVSDASISVQCHNSPHCRIQTQEEAEMYAAQLTTDQFPEHAALDGNVQHEIYEFNDAVPELNESDQSPFIVHVVGTQDTLAGLELFYNVRGDTIRRLNCMTSDRLVSYPVLRIPRTRSGLPSVMQGKRKQPLSREQLEKSLVEWFMRVSHTRDMRMRQEVIDHQESKRPKQGWFTRLLSSLREPSIPSKPPMLEEEAKFYLSESGWNLDEALAAAARDSDWELEKLTGYRQKNDKTKVEDTKLMK